MNSETQKTDIIILWDWEYDDDFVASLVQASALKGLHAVTYGPTEMESFVDRINTEHFFCPVVIDRASDVFKGLPLILSRMKSQGTLVINDPKAISWCKDKATMHLELLQRGVSVPYGIIASSEDHPETIHVLAIEKLGKPFVIKPSEGGGGTGVVLDAETSLDIQESLKKSDTGKIILQKKVLPKLLGERRGWFRIFYVLGEKRICWWDDLTHIYHDSEPGELDPELTRQLEEKMDIIAQTSQMMFFTSEIALDQNGEILVVDFVNEMCDMRIQSHHQDGIPDRIFYRIVEKITDHAVLYRNKLLQN